MSQPILFFRPAGRPSMSYWAYLILLDTPNLAETCSLMLLVHDVWATDSRNFSFLGYQLSANTLKVSAESQNRASEKIVRLYEQNAPLKRIEEFFIRWHKWMQSGFSGCVFKLELPSWITRLLDTLVTARCCYMSCHCEERFLRQSNPANYYNNSKAIQVL